jgi:hypothetical protein
MFDEEFALVPGRHRLDDGFPDIVQRSAPVEAVNWRAPYRITV